MKPKSLISKDANYIFLFKYTNKGAEELAASPERVKKANKFVEDISPMGGIHALCDFISLSGEYDMMTFFSGTPEQAYQLLLYLKSRGTVEVTMLKIETRSLREYTSLLAQTIPLRKSRTA